jgi:hypothetical protein
LAVRGSEGRSEFRLFHFAVFVIGAVIQARQFERPKAVLVDLAHADADPLRF